jgi:transposase InsO family protein
LEFSVTESSKARASNATYIGVIENFLYLTTVLDGYNRKIMSLSLKDGMRVKQSSLVAWKMAIKNRSLENTGKVTWGI